MTYEWRCEDCLAVTQVDRPMRDYQVGPRGTCQRCGSTNWKKMVSLPLRANGARSENSPFPMRLRHLEKPSYQFNDKGQIVGIKRDKVIFRNESEYNDHLAARGLVKMCDGEDAMVGESQHSVYDQSEAPPPSARAEQLAEQAYFVESPEQTFQPPT